MAELIFHFPSPLKLSIFIFFLCVKLRFKVRKNKFNFNGYFAQPSLKKEISKKLLQSDFDDFFGDFFVFISGKSNKMLY